METRVLYAPKSNDLKNPQLSIIQFLIRKGVFVESIQCSRQELVFSANEFDGNTDEHWSKELNSFFKDKILFKAKRPN